MQQMMQQQRVAQQAQQMGQLQQQMLQQKIEQGPEAFKTSQQLKAAQIKQAQAAAALSSFKATPGGQLATVGGDVGQLMAIRTLRAQGLNKLADIAQARYDATTKMKQGMATYYGLPQIGKLHKYAETIGKPDEHSTAGTTPDLAFFSFFTF